MNEPNHQDPVFVREDSEVVVSSDISDVTKPNKNLTTPLL